MSANEIVIFITRILYVVLSIIAIIDYSRHRSPRRRDFALMASALGLPFGVTLVRSINPDFKSPFLDLVGAFTLFSQPYFLFRLLQYFRPSRRGVGTVILVGLVLSCLLLWNQMATNPILTVTIIFSYCAIVEAYCTWGFYRGMSGIVGTLRRRLRIITISSAVFTLAFIINVVKAQFPTLSPSITPIAQAAAAVSAFLFYIAFIPSRWLQHVWQLEELYEYLSQTRSTPVSDTFIIRSFQQLSRGAKQATNALASGVLKLDEAADQWEVLTATDPPLFANLLQNGQALIKRAWQQRQAISSYAPAIADDNERHQLRMLGVQTWLLVPIQSQERFWGLLIVALRDRSLFTDDDLSLLELLAHECALGLDNHRLIDELQNYSGELEQKVKERTSALQRTNEELRRYAYVASHDLQEPLRTVTSYLQLIELRFPDRLDDEGREYIAFAVEGAMSMKNLIHDLLMYSRVEANECHFAQVDVQKVLDKTEKFLEVTIAETNACITHDALPQVVADEALLLQLFQNLIGNAIKYRSVRKPEIHIGASYKDRQWMFSIRDNGIGIEQKFLDRIFILFQRLHTREKYPGTGIGLAICKKAVELHDGRIWAESEIDRGTTFHFTIPVREAV